MTLGMLGTGNAWVIGTRVWKQAPMTLGMLGTGNAWVGFILVDFGGTGMCLWYCWKDLDEQDLIEFI
jgi:hypothetical protein